MKLEISVALQALTSLLCDAVTPVATCFPSYPSKREAHKWTWDGIMARTAPMQLEHGLKPREWHNPNQGTLTHPCRCVRGDTQSTSEGNCTLYGGRLLVPVCDRNCSWVASIPLCSSVHRIRAQHVSSRMSKEAHSTRMGKLGFSEPLHFCSCLIFFKSDSL